jgi:hypothetical protein
MIWNSLVFHGMLVEVQRFGICISFTSMHTNDSRSLFCIYGPCHGTKRDRFVAWLYNLQIPCNDDWLVLGDFNFL